MLESFDHERDALTRGELVRRSGLPPATGYRLISELIGHGLLDSTDEGVRPGVRLWELASRGSLVTRLKTVALPFMEDLQAIIRQHTLLFVLDGAEVVCIERLSARGSVANIAGLASRLPARVLTPGIVIAAYASQQVRDQLLATPVPSYTSHTPTTDLDLRRALADTRKMGFARADGWIADDVSARGLPIRDKSGHVVAALSIVLPNDPESIGAALPATRLAAASISRALGATSGQARPAHRENSSLTH